MLQSRLALVLSLLHLMASAAPLVVAQDGSGGKAISLAGDDYEISGR